MSAGLTILVGIYSPFAAWTLPPRQLDLLRAEFPHHTFLHARTDIEALALLPLADVAFMPEMRPAHLEAAHRLRWIHSPAAGVGGMLFPALIDSPVVLTNSRGLSAGTIAEHVIAVTLLLFRNLTVAMRGQQDRVWVQDAVVAAPLRMIAGSEVLVVGLGAIGSATAGRFHALGARVRGIRRQSSLPPPPGVARVSHVGELLSILPDADILVLAAPQTAQTQGLMGARELAAMRRHAILVNVGRGALVDEAALVAALTTTEAGRGIGGAALDVFEREPLPQDSPLWDLPNVVVTPHVAGFLPDHWDAVRALFSENLRRFEASAPLLNIVDKRAGY